MSANGRNLFDVNTNELLDAHIGPALLMTAKFGQTFPTSPADVVNVGGGDGVQWTPKTGWNCLGATKTGIKIERGFTKVDRSSDQSFGPYDSRPNNWSVMVTTEMVETTPENLALGWEGSPVTTTSTPSNGLTHLAIAAGDTTFAAPTASGIIASDIVLVDVDSFQEWHTVASVDVNSPTGYDTIHLSAGESFFYAHGAAVSWLVPGLKSAGYGRPLVITPRVVSVVAPVSTQSTVLVGGVNLLRAYAFRFCRLTDGQKALNHAQENDWTLPVGFIAYKDRSVADSSRNTFDVFDLTGV